MKLQPVELIFLLLFSIGLVAVSCTSGDTVSGGTGSGTGNSTGSGSGGTTGSGNSTGAGGSTARGGTTGTGNVTGQGGNTARGGTTGTGNVTGQGGTTGVGNTTGQGGTTGTGNVTGTGAGGTTAAACGSSFSVNPTGLVTMPSVGGCWSGYAYDGGDATSTILPGSFSTCGMPCNLTMTGTVGSATMANSYVGNAYLGFSLGQVPPATTPTVVTPRGSGITVTFTNASASMLRVQLNADSTGTTFWCTNVTTSPAVIPYSAFMQQCYNTPPGPAYAKQPILSVSLSVPGQAAAAAVNVTLVSVTENQ